MARVFEEKVTVRLSTILKDSESNPLAENESFLSEEQKDTLVQAIEGLLDNSAIVVEI